MNSAATRSFLGAAGAGRGWRRKGGIAVAAEIPVLIVGAGAGSEISRLCSRFGRHVEIAGFVDRLDDVFSTACALVVPLLAAGGLKLKILTALYYGLPILATEASVDGITMQDGIHFLRENAIRVFKLEQ